MGMERSVRCSSAMPRLYLTVFLPVAALAFGLLVQDAAGPIRHSIAAGVYLIVCS